MRRTLAPVITALALAPAAALAHPHVFIETSVEIVVTDGAVAGVRLTWVYDDFFSLVLTSELGIDADADLVLTDEEARMLQDYVLAWPEDFTGDLHVDAGGVPLALGGRQEAEVVFADGRVQESHFRPLLAPASGEVRVRVFDPFYYTAYQVVGEIVLTGPGCSAAYTAADLNAAYSLVDELLYGRPASDVGPEEAFPEVGEAFADTVTVTCAG